MFVTVIMIQLKHLVTLIAKLINVLFKKFTKVQKLQQFVVT